MSQYDAEPVDAPPVGTTDPSLTTTAPPVVPTQVTVAPAPDYTPAYTALEDLQLQESTVAEMLAVIEEAGRAIAEGEPRWVDPDVFGSSLQGARMARHTLRAQQRILDTLDSSRQALAQHHLSLTTYRDGVRAVEAETESRLAYVRAQTEDVVS